MDQIDAKYHLNLDYREIIHTAVVKLLLDHNETMAKR